jgi:hypothetical protein
MTFDHGGIAPPMVNYSHGSTETYTAQSSKIDEICESIRRLRKEQEDSQKVNEIQQRTFLLRMKQIRLTLKIKSAARKER